MSGESAAPMPGALWIENQRVGSGCSPSIRVRPRALASKAMNQSRTLRTCLSALSLCLVAACAAPTEAVVIEETRAAPTVLEGPLGELVSDLLYGLTDERRVAADELGSLGSDAAPATEHLILALEDEDPGVRSLAAEALGAIGSDEQTTLEALSQSLFGDLEESVQTASATALVHLGPASAEHLQTGLESDRASVRWQSARGLGRLGEDAGETLDLLLTALEDDDERVRLNAARAVGTTNHDSHEVIQPLIRAMTDEDEDVRGNAAWSLGQCGEVAKRAVLPLIDALRDEAPVVRMQAARALGELGPNATQASMDLASALDDPDPKVVHEVTVALEAIKQD